MRLNVLAYYADFFIGAAAMLALMLYQPGLIGANVRADHVIQVMSFIALGFAVWTLFEYGVHRVLYHNVPYFRDLHDAHHAEPNSFIGAPPVLGPVLIFALTYLPIAPFHEMAATGMTIGMMLGYLAYMLVHHAAHYWNLQEGSWLYNARRHHALHHHSPMDVNYGITTSFWDHVFGTAHVPGASNRKAKYDK